MSQPTDIHLDTESLRVTHERSHTTSDRPFELTHVIVWYQLM